MPKELIEALRTVAGQTSLNMPKELLEALRIVAGQTSLNMPKELFHYLTEKQYNTALSK
jgi:translation initiation factor 2B subunit (eIF-2B alpha/beta/delta family)